MPKRKKTEYKYRHTETYHGVRIDIKAHTAGDLADKLTRKRAQVDRQTISPQTPLLTFGKMFLKTYKEHKVSLSWYHDLTAMLENKIVPGIGNRNMGSIRPIMVQSFLNSLTGLSDSYIKKIFDFTRQLFEYAYKNGVITSDFSSDLVRPAGKRMDTGRAMTDAEETAFLKVITETPDELFLRIIYQCGLRPGEVCALEWRDIDLAAGTLTVSRAQKKDGSIGDPKSKAGFRTVPIPSTLLDLMREQAGEPFQLVCPKQRGGRHTKSSLRKMWNRTTGRMAAEMDQAVEKHGKVFRLVATQDPLRMYDLRHTYCTNLEKAGVPINIACRLMGHSDISVTSKIYTHESDTALEIARKLIDNAPSSPSQTGT